MQEYGLGWLPERLKAGAFHQSYAGEVPLNFVETDRKDHSQIQLGKWIPAAVRKH
jgi:hypothetical protein